MAETRKKLSDSIDLVNGTMYANADIHVINSSEKSYLQSILIDKKSPRQILDKCSEKIKSGSRNNQELDGRLLAVECPIKLLFHLQNTDISSLTLKLNLDRQQAQRALNMAYRLKGEQNAKVLFECGLFVDIKNPDFLKFPNNTFKYGHLEDMQLLILFLMRIRTWN